MILYRNNRKDRAISMSPEEISESFFSDTKMYENARLGWSVERALGVHLCDIGSYDRSDPITENDFSKARRIIIDEMIRRDDWKD